MMQPSAVNALSTNPPMVLVCPVCAIKTDPLNPTLPIGMGWCMQKQVEKAKPSRAVTSNHKHLRYAAEYLTAGKIEVRPRCWYGVKIKKCML